MEDENIFFVQNPKYMYLSFSFTVRIRFTFRLGNGMCVLYAYTHRERRADPIRGSARPAATTTTLYL